MFIDRNSCKNFLLNHNSTIKDSINAIEKGKLKIALVLNEDNKLFGTICDGDIRRGILKNYDLNDQITKIVKKNCLTANKNTSQKDLDSIMKENKISHIPILNDEGIFIGIEVEEEYLPNISFSSLTNSALIMAGGKGTRLRPLTNNCPKPMLKIQGKPILEIIIERCISSGIRNFFISVCYLSNQIMDYFGDGSKWNVNIEYLTENSPLGTAGALTLLPKNIKHPILIINGDVLTRARFRDIFRYHDEHNAEITICAREHILSSPYGVIEVEGISYKSMIEKPSFKQLVNAGIYVVNPNLISSIQKNKYLDMPDLIDDQKSKNKNILVYPIHEYWIDIGKPDLLNQATYDWSSSS